MLCISEEKYNELWSIARRVLRSRSTATENDDSSLLWYAAGGGNTLNEVKQEKLLTTQEKEDIFHRVLERAVRKDDQELINTPGYFGQAIKYELRHYYAELSPYKHFRTWNRRDAEIELAKTSPDFNRHYVENVRAEDVLKDAESRAELQEKAGEYFPVARDILAGYSLRETGKRHGISHKKVKRELVKILS